MSHPCENFSFFQKTLFDFFKKGEKRKILQKNKIKKILF